jgi:co-chaperonin GroES (HSP10)
MSELILPDYLAKLQQHEAEPVEPAPEEGQEDTRAVRATQLPTPCGWKILCAVPDVEDKYENSMIVKATMAMRAEEHSTTVLFVLKVGPSAYKDPEKFPDGAWCKEGDFVLVRAYSGTRFKIHGREFRMINDDQVEGTVQDPRGYTRAV